MGTFLFIFFRKENEVTKLSLTAFIKCINIFFIPNGDSSHCLESVKMYITLSGVLLSVIANRCCRH